MKVIWRGFWKVAIIRHINYRGKEEPSAVCMLDYNAERRMTDFANHSSFCFEVLARCTLCHLAFGELRHDSATQTSLMALAAPSLDVLERCIELIAKHC